MMRVRAPLGRDWVRRCPLDHTSCGGLIAGCTIAPCSREGVMNRVMWIVRLRIARLRTILRDLLHPSEHERACQKAERAWSSVRRNLDLSEDPWSDKGKQRRPIR